MRLYNTLTREIEDLVPLDDKKVGIYACGPTVYDYTHIGHIRKFVLDDVLVRLLRYLNYQVTHVMNITDVGHLVSDADTGEDKLEKGAKREGKTAWEVAKFYEDYFFQTMQAVNVGKPDIVCRATDHIKEQIELVKRLEDKGFTYTISDGVYFDSTKFPTYGKLSGMDPTKQLAGARVETVPGKKHATDFALWKLTPPGTKRDMEWASPWGKGFPGWHIECSAMSMKYLGESFDIHTGGIDHIPIHHTNEIAQSEAATGKPFVKFWVHHNFVLVNGVKMSKSLGNFYTLDDIKNKGFAPLALRYLFLQTHYRQESNFTWEALTNAQTALAQLWGQVAAIKKHAKDSVRSALSSEKLDKVNNLRKRFKDTIRFDLNTPQTLGVLWEIVKTNIPSEDKYDLLMVCDEILQLGLSSISDTYGVETDVPNEIKNLLQKREELRTQKKFGEADSVRQQIEVAGYTVEDVASGTRVKKKTY
ncbi:cysteine--tRNA ligase [Candidatus Gottesmanbacteria bacterium RIFCSPHIGHO2_01_FULL_43_15]|nr:MAG: cysteine--tRNA ligase [Candidatus Gottesmanbacteria bacterium RIFCSPHIGHO2_01_FULL_43_15]